MIGTNTPIAYLSALEWLKMACIALWCICSQIIEALKKRHKKSPLQLQGACVCVCVLAPTWGAFHLWISSSRQLTRSKVRTLSTHLMIV